MTTTITRRRSAIATPLLEPDSSTMLLERLWETRGPKAVVGIRKVIETLDHWLAHDDREGSGYSSVYPWTTDPVALLTARHDAIVRCEWLEARSRGADPGPIAVAPPTAEQLAGYVKAVLGLRAPARIHGACHTAVETLRAMVGRIRHERESRLRVYEGVAELLAETWSRNEASIAALAGHEAELERRLDRLSPIADIIRSRFDAATPAALGDVGIGALALGLARARGLEVQPDETSKAIDAAEYRRTFVHQEVANVPYEARSRVQAMLVADIDQTIAAERDWLARCARDETDRIAETFRDEVNAAAGDLSTWAALAATVAAHPECFPEGAAARLRSPLDASIEQIDAETIADLTPYF